MSPLSDRLLPRFLKSISREWAPLIGNAAGRVYHGSLSEEDAMRFSSLYRPAAALALAAGAACAADAAPRSPGSAPVAATTADIAVSCRKLSVNGSNIVAGSTLTVTVDGEPVARHDQYASGELGKYMKPAPIGLACPLPLRAKWDRSARRRNCAAWRPARPPRGTRSSGFSRPRSGCPPRSS